MIYDTIILGAGPAGLTAAIYAGRYNLKTLVIANVIGGTANLAGEVENWPGKTRSGIEIMDEIKSQADKFGAKFIQANIDKVTKDGDEFVLHYEEDKEVRGKSLIVALGTEHRQLNIPGEKKFLGKGVSYCATCDGNFFKNKTVAVVGGADAAAKAAIYLADICEKVYVIYRKHEMRCEPILLSNICSNPKIKLVYFSKPLEVLGENNVKQLKILTEDPDKDKEEKIINISGLFIEVGATPANEVVKELGVKLEDGYIITGKDTKTNVEGVFAAGDITNTAMRQMVTASAEGSIAAKMAHEFLMSKNF